MDWVKQALCAALPVEQSDAMFFGDSWPERKAGIRLCTTCPVRGQCLAAAARLEGRADPSVMAGTWGGLTVRQRAKLIKGRANA